MSRFLFVVAFLLGAAAVSWIALGFRGVDTLALTVTLVIGAVYVLGFVEQIQFRRATNTLGQSLLQRPADSTALQSWLAQLHPSLRNAVRRRIEGAPVPLPGPVLTPYLVGLLVMLGLLGTFIGMVVTLQGAVFALQGTTELQAIRDGLAAPIQGLSLAFGTSVAGVAASAMLGLVSTLSRRDRMLAGRELDTAIASELRPFSLAHSRQQAYDAIQLQSQALPALVDRLGQMADQMERMSHQVSDALTHNQARFHEATTQQYEALASRVSAALQQHLQDSARLTADTIRPIVADTLSGLADEARNTHQQVTSTAQAQLATLTERFQATADEVATRWQSGLNESQQHQLAMAEQTQAGLEQHSQLFAERSESLLQQVSRTLDEAAARQSESDAQRLGQWQQQLQQLASELVSQWQAASGHLSERQQQILDTLASTATRLQETQSESQARLLAQTGDMLQSAEALLASRLASENQWQATQRDSLQALSSAIREELQQLRADESQRGEAAVQQLAQLEGVVTRHLTELGTALEAPMTRLIETASETPRAAAEVISRLREEMTNATARDNALLEERQRILQQLDDLLTAQTRAADAQQQAIGALVDGSAEQLQTVADGFAAQVSEQASGLTELVAGMTANSADVASLSEAFTAAMGLFSAASDKLLANLQRIEQALDASASRHDEQLAYYVAQAREIIDVNMLSQREVIDSLRQLAPRSGKASQAVTEAG
ncbi:MAG: DUF802 domain-containing protein [Marinobacter sp.]|nr:DUF802 domain-containing protein [Marinobacter sp.]